MLGYMTVYLTDTRRIQMTLDLRKLEGPRDRPLVMVLTRYMPHFRRAMVEGLSERDDFDFVFVHSDDVPHHDTGLSPGPLPNSYVVKMYNVGWRFKFVYQPESIRLVKRVNPDVLLCKAPPHSLTVAFSAVRQWARGQAVVFWHKGGSPRNTNPIWLWARELFFRLWFLPVTVLVGYGTTSRKWFESLGFPPDRIVVAQNTIDTRSLLGDRCGWARRGEEFRRKHRLDEREVVGVACRLIMSKRVHTLIEAAAQVARRRAKLSLVIGGAGPDMERLKGLARRHPHLDAHFLGKLPIGEDNTLFAASDVNVFPGAVGLAIVQSMALGKPTICADEPHADSELIVDGETGLRFPRGDASALAERIERVLGDAEYGRQLGERGREHVQRNATIENFIERMVEAVRLAYNLRRRSKKDIA